MTPKINMQSDLSDWHRRRLDKLIAQRRARRQKVIDWLVMRALVFWVLAFWAGVIIYFVRRN